MIKQDARPTPYETAIARWENEGGAQRFTVTPKAPENLEPRRSDQLSFPRLSPPPATGTNTRSAPGRDR
jgi:hypothetical protein